MMMMRLDDDNTAADKQIRKRPLLEQYYLILHTLTEHEGLKMYEIARLINMNYYQLQRRIDELNKKNCIRVTDRSEITITDNGRKLKEQLENLLTTINKPIV
jgi:predicted transcriptional regulator